MRTYTQHEVVSCVLTEKRQKGALILHENKWGVSCLKPVSEFAPLKLKLTGVSLEPKKQISSVVNSFELFSFLGCSQKPRIAF